MSNLKWGFVAAAIALVISALLGIIFDVRPFYIFLRALIFSAVFFGIGFSIHMVINNFMPELLSLEEEPVIHENNQSGTRVDITLGNSGEYAVPEMYKDDDPDKLGNIEELISGAFKPRASPEFPSGQYKKSSFAELESIDGKSENDYNEGGVNWNALEPENLEFLSTRPSASAPPEKQVFTPSFGDNSDLGGLADLDAMATAFSGVGEPRPTAAPAPSPGPAMAEPIDDHLFDETAPIAKPASRSANKSQQLEGNFNPKELAQGIRTALAKEK